MPSSRLPLQVTAKLSLRSLRRVFSRPQYFITALLIAFITLGILVWITNWGLLVSIVSDSSFSVSDKLRFYWGGYESLVTNFSIASAAVLILFGALTGINAALLIFVVSRSYKEATASGGRNIIAIIAAAIGAGCAACGTSFLAPVLSGVAGGLSITLTNVVGIIANVAGIALLLYSIFQLSATAATYLAKEKK